MNDSLLPGRASASHGSIATVLFNGRRFSAYICGSSVLILTGTSTLVQRLTLPFSPTLLAFDELTGKLAVSGERVLQVYIYSSENESGIWQLSSSTKLKSAARTLQWGTNELLIGSESVSLWFSGEERGLTELWSQDLPNTIAHAKLSPNGNMLSSVGVCDRFLKVWRRIASGLSDTRFELLYLRHPRTVTSLHWRQKGKTPHCDNVLYTMSLDGILRIWTNGSSHDIAFMTLWTVVDVRVMHLDPLGENAISQTNIFIAEGIKSSTTEAPGDQLVDTKLPADSSISPDYCVAVYSSCEVSVWQVNDIGSPTRRENNIVKIMQNQVLEGGCFPFADESETLVYVASNNWLDLILIHNNFAGSVIMSKMALKGMEASKAAARVTIRELARWSGHTSASIKSLSRTADGKFMLSSAMNSDHILWEMQHPGYSSVLLAQSVIYSEDRFDHLVIVSDGEAVVSASSSCVVLWDCKEKHARKICQEELASNKVILCLVPLPEIRETQSPFTVAAICADGTGYGIIGKCSQIEPNESFLELLCDFILPTDDELLLVVPIDPVGWRATLSRSLDIFGRDVVLTIGNRGQIRLWTTRVSIESKKMAWLQSAAFHTGTTEIKLAKANSLKKVAIVYERNNELSIWDARSGQIELQTLSMEDAVNDLDWTCTPDDQSILAVGFKFGVTLLAQVRFDYLSLSPTWTSIQEISMSRLQCNSIWLSSGILSVGAGPTIFNFSNNLETSQFKHGLTNGAAVHENIFHFVSRLNGTLPVYHPQFLQQLVLAGKFDIACDVVVTLFHHLQAHLSSNTKNAFDRWLGLEPKLFISSDTMVGNFPFVLTKPPDFSLNKVHEFTSTVAYHESATMTQNGELSLIESLKDMLQKVKVPHLTATDQMLLAVTVESLQSLDLEGRALDKNAIRYLLILRQHLILRKNKVLQSRPLFTIRESVWALHSVSKEILLDTSINALGGYLNWDRAREVGLFLWLENKQAITEFESIARVLYTVDTDHDPAACTLYYLALRKKNLLIGLWRMSGSSHESQAIVEFLGHNFTELQWRTAAKKNAYVLLSKQRFGIRLLNNADCLDLAAAFFLLADSLQDVVHVCLKYLADFQLAIALVRVYEGDDSEAFRDLLQDQILPMAAGQHDRWLASWAFWKLDNHASSVKALLAPLESILDAPNGGPPRSFTEEDPALVVLYEHLREKTVSAVKGSGEIAEKVEFDFLMHVTRLYDRMGCDILALDLIYNWRFTRLGNDDKRKQSSDEGKVVFARRRRSTIIDKAQHHLANTAQNPDFDMSAFDW